MITPDDVKSASTQPWEQQPFETAPAFHGFTHYRDLLPDQRSLDRAYAEHRRACCGTPLEGKSHPKRRRPKSWMRWSSEWRWVERVAAHDREQDRLHLAQVTKSRLEAAARHARFAQGIMSALSGPVRATIEALADPNVVQQMTVLARSSPSGALTLLNQVIRIAGVLPGLVAVERLSLGMVTESIEVNDRPGDDLARRIRNDPAAVDLAVELLDRLAGTSTGTAEAEELAGARR